MKNFEISKGRIALILQLLALVSYVYIGVYMYDFPRKIEQLFVILIFSFLLEEILSYSVDGKFKFPASALITGCAIFMLVTSLSMSTYLIAVTVAIVGKYVIRYNGKGVFNPGNFGVLFVVIFLRDDIALAPGQWGAQNQIILLASVLGLLACTFADRLVVAVSYILTFAFLAYVRTAVYGDPILLNIGPLLGMSGVIFQFHMITDPQTTPSKYQHQIIFGICVAVLDTVLRFNMILFSQFISLSVICAIRVMLENRSFATVKV